MAMALKGSASGNVLILAAGLAAFSVASMAAETGAITELEGPNINFVPATRVYGVDLSGTSLDVTPSGTYDERLQFAYFWETTDAYDFVNVTRPATLGHGSSGQSYCPRFAHTFRTGNTLHTVSCSVFGVVDGTLYEVAATLAVNTGDNSTIFSGNNTIFVSTDGNFAGAPSGSLNVTATDIASVYDTYIKGQETTPKRMILRAGQSFTNSSFALGNGTSNRFPTLLIASSDPTSTNPVVTQTGGTGFSLLDNQSAVGDTKEIVFDHVDFVGGWDSTTNTGTADRTMFGSLSSPTVPNMIAFDGCRVTGFNFHTYFTAPINCFALNDSEFSDFRFSNIYMFNIGTIVSVGSFVGSAVGARVNDGSGGFNGGFAWRTDSLMTIVDRSETFICQGWSGGGGTGGMVAYQPNMRINSDGRANTEHYVVNSVLEGGFSMLSFSATQPALPVAVKMNLCEYNYFVGDHQSGEIIGSNCGGTIARNNIAVMPDTSEVRTTSVWMLNVQNNNGAGNGNAENLGAPMHSYNNTIIELRDGSDGALTFRQDTAGGTFTDTRDANNVRHLPNKTSPVTPFAPINTSGGVLFPPLATGYRDPSGNVTAGTITPTNTARLYEPESGSSALEAATGSIPHWDIKGVRRTSPEDSGALQIS